MRFSIIVVCLNAGEKLRETLESIRSQSFRDYQVVIKDGGSKDNSLTLLKEQRDAEQETDREFWSKIEIYEERDKSIYEGMNQAVKYAKGEYLYFLNCGDCFYDREVLARIHEGIDREKSPAIYYGDIYDALRNVRVASNPRLDGFGCYRNVPCHQACFYEASLFLERGYETGYRVRGDYEHFLWCFYEKKAGTVYLPVVIASYEGGGYSETRENRIRSKKEHREITAKYMTRGELFRYRLILLLTLAPLRTKMAESRKLSGIYSRCKQLLYGRNRG